MCSMAKSCHISTAQQKVCKDFGIRGYPTVKLIRDGKQYAYKGQRTLEAFTVRDGGGMGIVDVQEFYRTGYATAEVTDLPEGYEKKVTVTEVPVPQAEHPSSPPPAAASETAQPASGNGHKVVELTVENFDSNIASGSWFIKFFSPRCPHCRKIAQPFADAAAQVNGATFGEVDWYVIHINVSS